MKAAIVGERVQQVNVAMTQIYEPLDTQPNTVRGWLNEARLDAATVAEILIGLNWLCNENLEQRAVAQALWNSLP